MQRREPDSFRWFGRLRRSGNGLRWKLGWLGCDDLGSSDHGRDE
jgi:hypothetical protein